MKIRFCYIFGLSLLFLTTLSCDNELHITMPAGPAGPQGASAYEVWAQAVRNGDIEWDENRIDVENFFLFLQGKDGIDGKSAYQLWKEAVLSPDGIDDPHNPNNPWNPEKIDIQDFWRFLTGAKGQDGSLPSIGSNGNWFIDGADTGVPARGQDGVGSSNVITIGPNDNWFIDGIDTEVPARGQEGGTGAPGTSSVITIGFNGNWFIDGVDQGIQARGDDGVTRNISIVNGNWHIDGVDQGIPAEGHDGRNSVVTIGINGYWFIDGIDTGIPARGQDGSSSSSVVVIGDDGNWYIDGENTGRPAVGTDGVSSIVNIGADDNWYIDGVNTGIPARGADGSSSKVIIGDDGNWVIDGENTGIPARGQDGRSSVVVVGANGNWYVDGIDTGIPAQGYSSVVTIGDNGNWYIDGNDTGQTSRGQSAYELWVLEVAKGIQDPHLPWREWPKDETSTNDFWYFLRGEDGRDAVPKELEDERIETGRPNVLAQRIVLDLDEFVNPEDGSVRYRVYDRFGDPAANAKVEITYPEVIDVSEEVKKEFTADANGYFTIDKYDLPTRKLENVRVFVTINGGVPAESSANTVVPRKMLVRIRLQNTHPVPRLDIANAKAHIAFQPVVERSEDGGESWQRIPAFLGGINALHGIKAYRCEDPDDYKSFDIKLTPFVTSILPTTYNNLIDVTKTDYIVRVNRLRRAELYYHNPADPWDGDDHYFTLVVDGTYYGDILQLNAVIKMAPIQGMPFIKDITAADFSLDTYSVRPVTGEFDVSNVDPDLMFKPAFTQDEKGGFTYYEPEVDPNFASAAELIVTFGTGASANRPVNLPTVAHPGFSIQSANISKATTPTNWISIALTTNTHYFYSLNTIGRFRFKANEEGHTNSMIITKTGSGAAYVYDDIAVEYKTP